MGSGKSTTSTPTGTLSRDQGSPAKGKQVDKNALSARGSPKGEQSEHTPDGTTTAERLRADYVKAKKPKRDPTGNTPWKEPMLKASRAPPPPDAERHGKWVQAKDAGIEYGNPLRYIWVRTGDRKVWELDVHDGDHLAGYHVARGVG